MLRKLIAKTRQLIFGKYILNESFIPHRYWVIRRHHIANDEPLPYVAAMAYAAKLNGEEIKV